MRRASLTLPIGSSTYAVIWLQVETKLGIVSACLPILPPLLRRISKTVTIPSFISSMHTSLHSRFTRFSAASTAGNPSTKAHAAMPGQSGVVSEVETVGSSSNPKNEKKDWHSVAMSNLSTSGKTEASQSGESLIQEQETPSSAV